MRVSQAGNANFAAATDVTRSFNVTADRTRVFFSSIFNRSNQKVGDLAASLPPQSKEGTLIIVCPQLGLNLVLDFTLAADGSFSVPAITNVASETSSAASAPNPESGTPLRAAATQSLTLRGSLAADTLAGGIDELGISFATTVQPPTGPTAALAGFYQSSAVNTNAGSTATIVGPQNQILIVATTPALTTGALGSIAANGTFTVATTSATIAGAIDAAITSITGSIAAPNLPSVPFSGIAAVTARNDRLINLSSRARVSSASNRTLITGFVIGGTAPKRVLLRAVGPALDGFGVQGALANPRLQLYDHAGKFLLENDDWSGTETSSAFVQVGAFSLPNGSRDAAVVTILQPGAYTMHVIDGAENGIALAEIYDASLNPSGEFQRLVNISSRGTVDSSDGVLIGGFVITGTSPKKVLIRGIGPALAAFGVNGVLADPRLAIYAGSNLIARNDDWGTAQAVDAAQTPATTAEIAAAAQATGAFTLAAGTKDAAVLLTLAPGAYTAQVAATNAQSGVALVEIYEVP